MLSSFARVGVLSAVLGLGTTSAHAALVITEAMSSSGVTPDWFEVTNTGPAAVTVTGYRMDDNSNLFANSVLLSGITNIASGESVVFVETDAPLTDLPAFRTFWGGAALTAQIGSYPSAGLAVGLSSGASGDAVNVYDSAGTAAATAITFGQATTGVSFNRPGNGTDGTFGSLSQNGVGGTYQSLGTPTNTASPGVIAPEPTSLAALLAAGRLARRRRA